MALTIASSIAPSYGWGIHEWDQRPEWYSSSELISWIIQLMYILNMFLTKAALLVSYLRFCRPGKFRISVYVAIVIVCGWAIGAFVTTLFECFPIQYYWLSRNYDHCPMNDNARLLACVLTNIVTDFIVCLMPLRIVWHIKLPLREKVVLYVLLSLGLMYASSISKKMMTMLTCETSASIASIVRTIVMDQAITTFDIAWYGYSVWVWTCIECDLAIICASVPCLRPLSKKFFRFILFFATTLSSTDHAQSEVHNMENFPKKSARPGEQVAGTGGDFGDNKIPRLGVVPSVAGTSEESLV
jgi:hypothetical protein